MLIKMIDGGMVNYRDDSQHYAGCPTCNYGSEFINEIWVELTKYRIYVKTNQMYSYAISEEKMMVLLLSNCNEIQAMTEKEFIDWFKKKLCEITHDDIEDVGNGGIVERFDVTEVE